MPKKKDSPRNRIIPTRNKTVPVQRKIISGMVRKTHVATYFGSYFTSMSARGLEIYDKSQPQKLVCVYKGTKFIMDSSDDDLKIFRI